MHTLAVLLLLLSEAFGQISLLRPLAPLAPASATIRCHPLLQGETANIITCLGNPNVIKNFRKDQSFNQQFLQEDFGINGDHIGSLYQYAKFQFDCGSYGTAAELLDFYKALCTNSEQSTSATWGKLAADILLQGE